MRRGLATPDATAVPGRLRGDAGTALAETAFVAPIFFLILLGILEFGLVFRDYLTINDGVADAVKFGAIQGPKDAGGSADRTMINLVRQDLAFIPTDWIKRIVVYRAGPATAGTPLAQVPSICKTATTSSTAAKCNIYFPNEAFLKIQTGDTSYFACTVSTQPSCGWPPSTRKNGPKNTDIEYVGVYIKLERVMPTGLFGKTYKLEGASIQRIEPGILS